MSSKAEKTNLCATCFYFGCDWHEHFKPVKGWEATPTLIKTYINSKGEYVMMTSYKVQDCPLYRSRNGHKKDITLREISERTGIALREVFRKIRNGEEITVDGCIVRSYEPSGCKYKKYYLEG